MHNSIHSNSQYNGMVSFSNDNLQCTCMVSILKHNVLTCYLFYITIYCYGLVSILLFFYPTWYGIGAQDKYPLYIIAYEGFLYIQDNGHQHDFPKRQNILINFTKSSVLVHRIPILKHTP